MTDAPEILPGGRLPVSVPRGGYGREGMDWITTRLIEAQILGIDEEVPARPPDDFHCKGRPAIPAGVPLDLTQAAHAVGMRLSRARRLVCTPTYLQAFDTAIRAYRASQCPANIRTAIKIRDNEGAADRDRLRAVQVLEGPRAIHIVGQVTNNFTQNNDTKIATAGYVIMPREEAKPATIEGEVVGASPRDGNAGNAAADFEAQRDEEHRFRPR